ncbi:MAG: NAD(+) diphosphatase [Lachnospiraceae bacterium]|nr:NAD(+) diphosphatase [Lachnospiraceae bacterium]
MIQDIAPRIYNNNFTPRAPKDTDYVLVFFENQPWMIERENGYEIPTYKDINLRLPMASQTLTYLFTIDDYGIFLLQDVERAERLENRKLELIPDMEFQSLRTFRTYEPRWLAFAGVTASHLAKWYATNRYCGGCGSPMKPSEDERAMVCEECGFIDYPKICPAVIVAVINKDKILMSKYANRSFTRYALLAGFCEIGETLEDTVRREVMEEVGIKVKNIRYYKSQPWGFSESLLVGFFAELDGEEDITLDTSELAEAGWFSKDEIPDDEENNLSLTYTMMQKFKNS